MFCRPLGGWAHCRVLYLGLGKRVPRRLAGRAQQKTATVPFRSRGADGASCRSALLADALTRIVRSEIAAYALVVDAKDEEAASFYRHHGFLQLATKPLTLFLPLATAPVPTLKRR